MKVPLIEIEVKNRYRQDLGNLGELAASISERGLLQPIVLDLGNKLVAGERRLEAVKLLGWTEIEATVVDNLTDVASLLCAERDENTCRKDFTHSEAAAMAAVLEPFEQQLAKARQERGVNQHSEACEKIPQGSSGRTADKVAASVGMSAPTLKRVKAVVNAAKADPVKFGHVLEKMDKTRNVAAAYREVVRAEQAAKLNDIATREVKAAQGVYDVIVVDPPWPMKKIERDCAPEQVALDYPTMDEAELADLKLPCAENCHIWLWTTHKFFPMAMRLLDVWGLKYVCIFTWHKNGGFQVQGLPQFNSEFAIYCRKGTPQFVDTKDFNTCFCAKRGRHSEKPEEFYDVVRRVTAGRRLDMFNRRYIEDFDLWGNEAGGPDTPLSVAA